MITFASVAFGDKSFVTAISFYFVIFLFKHSMNTMLSNYIKCTSIYFPMINKIATTFCIFKRCKTRRIKLV